jgi:spore coat polysaccharide biosynthesis protein SpsF
MPRVRLFIQARMSSIRFPGKVLAPFNGRPIIAHVVSRTAEVLPLSEITVATSTHESDDPLAGYVGDLGVSVFRGPLEDVFERFRLCLEEHPCDWVFRVSADSPLFDPRLIPMMLAYADTSDLDLVTNVFPRTFPKGRSLEMINADTFLSIDSRELSPEQQEHVTPVFYDNPERFRILNIESGDPSQAEVNLSVDTVADFRRLEAMASEAGNSVAAAVGGEASE